MDLLHQGGFNTVWNIESFREDDTGGGVILGPRYERKERIQEADRNLKEKCIFDPQFFLPDTAAGDLETYEFHPQVMSEGFDTAAFAGSDTATASAKQCLSFQKEQGFAKIVIPTRYRKGMPTDFIQQLNALFVEPYLEAADELGIEDDDLLIQLVLNDSMVTDDEYRKDILNWVTGIQEVDGVYLLVQKEPRRKQIEDVGYLYWILRFIDVLREAHMEVIHGYCNTEGVILSLADPTAITMGSYENMRMFRVDTFEETDGGGGPPTPRIFSAKLLQWINHNYIGAIEVALGEDRGVFFEDNKYQATLFDPDFKWHFMKPSLYKHFFMVFDELVSDIDARDGYERYEYVDSLLVRATDYFSRLGDEVIFGREGGDRHLPPWKTAVNQFADYKGWT